MGSRADEESLRSTFSDFRFESDCNRNLKLDEIKEKVRELRKKDFGGFSCLVVAVFSHGYIDETLYAYDKQYNLRNILVMPIASNPSLRGKPKIFIISACKGGYSKDNDPTPNVPMERDILICYSTFEGMYYICISLSSQILQ